jgi:citrate synthase
MGEDTERAVVRGLKDVAAAETKISFVDPMGFLYYLGYNIDDLVGRVTYPEVAYLLIYKRLPNQQELEEFSGDLISEMKLPDVIVDSIRSTPKHCHPMTVLRTEVSRPG